jgi:phytoene synthase
MAADDGAAHAEAVVARSGTSFYWSMRLLPPDQRAAMFAVYAFCREIDDIADGDDPTAQKLAALADWRAEIERVFTAGQGIGGPRGATGRSLVAPVRRFALARADFIALIDGMEMDATGPIVAPDWATLRLYCARVAGASGCSRSDLRPADAAGQGARRRARRDGTAHQHPARRDEDAGLGQLQFAGGSGTASRRAGEAPRRDRASALGAVAAEVGAAARAFAAAARVSPRSTAAAPARVIFAVWPPARRLLAVALPCRAPA